jgi:hypothetical protein
MHEIFSPLYFFFVSRRVFCSHLALSHHLNMSTHRRIDISTHRRIARRRRQTGVEARMRHADAFFSLQKQLEAYDGDSKVRWACRDRADGLVVDNDDGLVCD